MDDGSTVKLGPVMVQSELLTILSHGRVTFLFSLVLAFAIVADRGCGSAAAAVLKPPRVVSSVQLSTCTLMSKLVLVKGFDLRNL